MRYYDDPKRPGVTLPSVTTILDVAPQPWMGGWTARKVAELACAEPWQAEAGEVAYLAGAAKRFARQRAHEGTKVHAAIASGDWSAVDLGYRRAYRKWFRLYQPEFVGHELECFNRRAGYAGRLDALAYVDGRLTVIDWKTGGYLYRDRFLQVEAYRRAVGADNTMVVILRSDGSFDADWDHDADTSWEMFRTFQKVYEWKVSK